MVLWLFSSFLICSHSSVIIAFAAAAATTAAMTADHDDHDHDDINESSLFFAFECVVKTSIRYPFFVFYHACECSVCKSRGVRGVAGMILNIDDGKSIVVCNTSMSICLQEGKKTGYLM